MWVWYLSGTIISMKYSYAEHVPLTAILSFYLGQNDTKYPNSPNALCMETDKCLEPHFGPAPPAPLWLEITWVKKADNCRAEKQHTFIDNHFGRIRIPPVCDCIPNNYY